MTHRTILVAGAGIAGLALAHWLRRLGFEPTVVERAPAPRTGGHAIDVRGAALRVVRRMGLEERVEAASTRMRGMSFVDGDGNELMRTEEETLTGGPKGIGVEVFRDDLGRMLLDVTREGVEHLAGDGIEALEEDERGVEVTFASGARRRFDLVVGADGLHSSLRAMVFGPESDYLHPLGQYLAVFPIENYLGLDHWQVFLRGEREMVGVYSANGNRDARVMFGAESEPLDISYRDVAAQKAWIATRFRDLGWETPRFLRAMQDSPSFYFDSISQIRMPTWSKGRVVLVGDAACSASPLSGQGTSVALVGAYVLAHALRSHANHSEAFAAYEARVRPFALANQQLALDSLAQGGPPDAARLLAVIDAIDLPEAGA